jgi:hypothetical protein
MANVNELLQKVVLDIKGYLGPLAQMTSAAKTSADDINKSQTDQSKTVAQNESQYKKWGKSVSDELKKVGSAMKENALAGATIGLGAKAAQFTGAAIEEAGRSMLKFGESMSKVRLKLGDTVKDMDGLERSLKELAKNGTNLDSIPDAFDEINASLKDPLKSLEAMKELTHLSDAMGSKDSRGAASFAKNVLTSEGKELSPANINQLSTTVATMMKSGAFSSVDEAMKAFGALDHTKMKDIGMGNDSAGAMLSAASGVGSKEQSMAAINGLIKAEGNGFEGSSVLSGLLGGNLLKNGKLDPAALGRASKAMSGMKSQERKKLLQEGGLSEEEASGLDNILQNSEKFKQGLDNFKNSTTTAAQAADILNDNVAGKLNKFKQDVAASWSQLGGDILHGNVKGAMGDVVDNAGTLASSGGLALGGAAAGAMALKGVGKLLGGFSKAKGGKGGVGGVVSDLIGGASEQKVFVTNLSELSSMASGGAGGIAQKAGSGLMAKFGAASAGLAIGVEMGSLINEHMEANADTNKFGQKYTSAEKGLAKIIPEWAGGMSAQQYKDTYVKVEIINKAKGFTTIDNADQMQREAKSQ